jgi:hypothetical protein
MQARVLSAAVFLVIAIDGCSSILQIEPGQLDDSSTGTPSSSSSGGGVSACDAASDCPAPPFPDCRAITCVAHRCVGADAAAGTPTTSQIAGDCQQIECDGHGLVHSVDANDPRDDGRECTDDTCAQGLPVNTAKPSGTPCQQGGGAVCTDAGECVGCLSDADCPGMLCKAASCVPMGCSNMVKDGGETDTDCGGPCSPCADGLSCVGSNDCMSGVCKGKKCKSATCSDTVKNGAESDTDCGGGACPSCVDGKTCNGASDCIGAVCNMHSCCTPLMDVMTCLGHCGPITNNCGVVVTCGGCPSPATCVQGACVCVPEPPATTCANKCGLVANNCGLLVDCGPCGP